MKHEVLFNQLDNILTQAMRETTAESDASILRYYKLGVETGIMKAKHIVFDYFKKEEE